MNDLFTNINDKTDANSYSASDIEILEGLEPVRKRPAMYIGGTDSEAMHHLINEVLDNSFDEAVAKFASKIVIHLKTANIIAIEDNGRGIPIDPHPKHPDKSALEIILTTLHSGGKFNSKVYETSGGLHGVGISVVNALSEYTQVTVQRNKQIWQQRFERGLPVTKLEASGKTNKTGTLIEFKPDEEIFGNANFNPKKIYNLSKSKAYLYKDVEVIWKCEPELLENIKDVPANDVIHFPNGLIDYLNFKIKNYQTLIKTHFSGTEKLENIGKIEWAVTWLEDDDSDFKSYCNTIPTPLGGTHENGFRNAILKAVRNFAEMVGIKKISAITADDVFTGAVGVISAFIRDPHFQGQTKEKLVSSGIAKEIESAVKDHVDHWLNDNSKEAQILINFIQARAEERAKRKKAKELNRKSITQRICLPGKLADCSRKMQQGTELFIVEGDSAGGSAKQGRNRETQAILPLRGKILNVASATLEKIKANQSLNDLEQAIGCGIGKHFDLSALRYEKIIIMTDADVDGAHIASLLMTYFIKKMPEIIRKGHLYIAKPPLYRIQQKDKSYYVLNDKEKDQLLKKIGDKNIQISRFKGLGEMTAQQLKETTMNPKKRSLYRVVLNEETESDSSENVEILMGKNPESRFKFIQENALSHMGELSELVDL